MKPTVNALRVSAGTLVTLTSILGGCGAGHGAHTSRAAEEGQLKMSSVKSGVEYQIAQEQFLAGELSKATKTIEGAIALNPTVAKSHVLRARIMIERGELESARASLLRAEEIDAEVVEAHYYLGIVHERFSQPEEALRRYRLAAKLEPTSAQFVIASAEMLIHLKRLDEAEALLSSPHQALTHNAAIRQTSGHIAMLRGQAERAADLFAQARLLAPDDASVVEDLVRAQMAAKNYGDAEVNIGTILRGKDNEARRDLMLWRAECLAATNRLVEARSVLDRLTGDREGQADLAAWLAMGRVAAALKDDHRLRQAAQHAIALAPDRSDGYLMRAIHLRSTGELPGALIAIDTAIRLDHEATTPRLLRALILQEMGMTDDAAKSLTHVLERHPNHPLAGRMLAMVESTAVYAAVAR